MSIVVRKHSAVVQVSRDTLVEYGLVQPTAEERAQMQALSDGYHLRKRAAAEALPGFLAALEAVSDPVARAVLNLHKAGDRGECVGCDADGYEWEQPAWPCRTTTTVAGTLGITVPEDLYLVLDERL